MTTKSSVKLGTILAASSLILAACTTGAGAITPSITSAPTSTTTIISTTTSTMTTIEAQAALDAQFKVLQQARPKDETIIWSAATTPLFPSEWPPTANTIWSRYAYGMGHELQLADAVRISSPWARVDYRAGQVISDAVMSVVPLSNSLEAVDTQGVRPLPADQAAPLQKSGQVFATSLTLQALPTESEAADIRAYYKAWLQYNGAIVKHLTLNADFMEWVSAA